MRFIFALLLGGAAGYFAGWQDGKTHDKNIVERLVARAGGSTRDKLNTNADSMLNATSDPANKR